MSPEVRREAATRTMGPALAGAVGGPVGAAAGLAEGLATTAYPSLAGPLAAAGMMLPAGKKLDPKTLEELSLRLYNGLREAGLRGAGKGKQAVEFIDELASRTFADDVFPALQQPLDKAYASIEDLYNSMFKFGQSKMRGMAIKEGGGQALGLFDKAGEQVTEIAPEIAKAASLARPALTASADPILTNFPNNRRMQRLAKKYYEEGYSANDLRDLGYSDRDLVKMYSKLKGMDRVTLKNKVDALSSREPVTTEELQTVFGEVIESVDKTRRKAAERFAKIAPIHFLEKSLPYKTIEKSIGVPLGYTRQFEREVLRKLGERRGLGKVAPTPE